MPVWQNAHGPLAAIQRGQIKTRERTSLPASETASVLPCSQKVHHAQATACCGGARCASPVMPLCIVSRLPLRAKSKYVTISLLAVRPSTERLGKCGRKRQVLGRLSSSIFCSRWGDVLHGHPLWVREHGVAAKNVKDRPPIRLVCFAICTSRASLRMLPSPQSCAVPARRSELRPQCRSMEDPASVVRNSSFLGGLKK